MCLNGLVSCLISSYHFTGELAVLIGEDFFDLAVLAGLFCLKGDNLSTVLEGEA